MLYYLCMEIKQKLELRRHLVPELSQSLNILALPLLDIKNLIEKELEDNPLLEESLTKENALKKEQSLPLALSSNLPGVDQDFRLGLITKKISLQEALLRQLGMFTNSDEEFRIGQEIIGNVDENGYLKASLQDIASALNLPLEKVENVLKLVQKFEPAGVCARTIQECLLIQIEITNENDTLLRKVIELHLDDVAKKKYSLIAKSLRQPLEKIEQIVKKILKLDPKPGRNYSLDEAYRIIPDISVDVNEDDEIDIAINNEDIPAININKEYREMLKNKKLDPQTKEFLNSKLQNALQLLRAISRRQTTLRRIVEIVFEIQQEAIKDNLSYLKPLTFLRVAEKINMHESTVCRAIMNKYVKTPHGIVALKDFFPSYVHDQNGTTVSSSYIKKLIKELIEQENINHPLSDQEIYNILSREKNLKLSRRTIAKYRDELKILSSSFRKIR